MAITDADLQHPYFVIGVIAATVAIAEAGYLTPTEALTRLRDVLARSGQSLIEPPPDETADRAVAPDGGHRGPL